MKKIHRDFQVFVKPTGSLCNLNCVYCYYLEKVNLYSNSDSFRMSDEVLEAYIKQHIKAASGRLAMFSWHGGEPTILGLNFFRKIVEIQKKHRPKDIRIINGIQTNGTLLDDEWCQFLVEQGFIVGISLDGPPKIHDKYRLTKEGKPTFNQVMKGYRLLQKNHIPTEILCVVNAHNVQSPLLVYRFFKQIKAKYITFLPLVEPKSSNKSGVSETSVTAEEWGRFLCTIFDEWMDRDVGSVDVQIFEEAARTAFNRDHSLCIFRPVCGDVPVVEHNGDFYPCDHFVDSNHLIGNIIETPLIELLESTKQRTFGLNKLEKLPRYCRVCEVLYMCNGECPKNRFVNTPDGEPGLNYLCDGYKQFFTHCMPFVSELAKLRNENTK